ncbi:E3 UFM1-protein ligase 1 homolog [Dendroctonus ponderosae]|uniref:E3 UFM1-protein ligase 1 homolog n=1 Tax=Dendroctonus ponderosae TaxID=77166 RepID=U4U460_DENPD|nr:E3 UFM1-protein ligase 1 homolog [Dendroctonus ponderosae]ERL87133.1 hypothetical protein D910_04533 [Dendroctonus ponderosae]KAH1004796.1 hypothetical protein HUJ05_005571 [Dendroctonus ponderosae]KAH1004798.1 hypothetical protein HUJ05_005571 [Dendroctonus ponderosae]
MSDWEEIKRLAADFQKVQLSVSAQKLSERNCVEIVSWLIEKKLIDLIFTSDGKEYLTPAQLVTDIQNELYVSGGRISLGDLAKNIGVDFGQVNAHLNQVLKGRKDVQNVLGQLIDHSYTLRIAGEINEKLQQQGHINVSDLTIAYDLPADFLQHQVLEKHLGGVIQAIQDPADPKSFFIEAFISRAKAQLKGALNGLSRPVAVGSIVSQIGISEKLFFGLFEQSCAFGSLTSRQSGAQYIPSCYTRGQNEWSRAFLKQNQYLEFDALIRIGISDPKSYIRKVHAADKLFVLDSMAVAPSLLERVNDYIEECIAIGGFVDLETSLPSSITPKDLSLVVEHLLKGQKNQETVLLESFVLSKAYMDKISDLCSEAVQHRAKSLVESGQYQKHQVELQSGERGKLQRGKEEDDRVDKREERRKKAAGGKSGGGTQGRETKTKSTKRHSRHRAQEEDDDQEVEEESKKAFTVLPLEVVSELIQPFLEDEGLDSILEAIAQHLQPLLNERVLQLAADIFKETIADKTALRRRRHQEFASRVENLINELRWYQKGCKLLPVELQASITKYLLKSICSDLVAEFLGFAVADSGAELDISTLTSNEKLKFLSQNSDYAALLPLFKALSGTSLEEFTSALDPALDACGVFLRKVDKKQDRSGVLRVKLDLLKELQGCEDPATVLHLATLVLFSTATQTLLHISGKHISAVLGFLKPQMEEAQHAALMNYHDFIAVMLRGGSEVEKLKEQMEAVKTIAREYKRSGEKV